MAAVPLLTHSSPAAVLAWRGGFAVTAHEFLCDVRSLALRLPPARHVLNVCADRYRFAVGFAACLLGERSTLLPSTHTPGVVRQLAAFAPDTLCLTDDPRQDIDLPQFLYPDDLAAAAAPWRVPTIDADRLAAIVFTSGTTGTPLPHRKTWGRLAACVRDEAKRLKIDDGRSHALLGTVPPQHMYGFESTVLLALQSGNALIAERPFYPADVAAAIAAAPRPRVLVSTPVHLRALLAAGVELAAADLVVSATAPLGADLAAKIERRFDTALIEIYGSTETGQIASRRTAEVNAWRLWPGVHLSRSADCTFALGGHLEQRTALCDVVEPLINGEFLLHGRTADLVNIAGKRSSFAYLDHQLNAIPGVVDGAFFPGDPRGAGTTGVTRLAAAVVAPTLNAAELLAQLRERVDPAFLPRPLLLVERLPRNATGKLPYRELRLLAAKSK
ncbi:MAG TPA: AMP-binding protein [Steroidobacteraceae bacterium]|nr:AMP-binding protein [Steroidobacteraceae bacterium]